MHRSAHDKMKACLERYMPSFDNPSVLDFGSRMVANQKTSHKDLFNKYKCEYKGCDVASGPNVDIVMPEPYTIPLEDDSIDIVITGQVIEHVPYFWASFMELARILKKGGIIICTAPSRGHLHCPPYDCWRFHPDGFKAIASFAGLHLKETSTDLPPTRSKSKYYDYSGIQDYHYWGDTFGVFYKTDSYKEKEISAARKVIQKWANKTASVHELNEASIPSAENEKTLSVKHKSFDVWFPHVPEIITPAVLNSIIKGYYEAKEARAILKYMKPGARILELGAGLGFMACISTQKKPEAYVAIEADPRLIPVMKATHNLNGVENVLIHNCAVTSDKDQLNRGYIELQQGNEFWGSSIKQKKGSGNYVKIDTVSLASYLTTYSPNVLIIDIEGAEVDLFHDVQLDKINLIVLETHPGVTGTKPIDEMIAYLTSVGMKAEERQKDNPMLIFTR